MTNHEKHDKAIFFYKTAGKQVQVKFWKQCFCPSVENLVNDIK